MARTRHTDPHEALNDLLDQHERAEARGGATKALTTFVSQSFASPAAEQSFASVIRAAEATGCVALEMDKGDMAHLMKRVILFDAGRLYVFLSRLPQADIIKEAVDWIDQSISARAEGDLAREAREVFTRISARWAARQKPYRLAPEDKESTVDFVLSWGAVRIRDPEDNRDLRTYSRQALGNSKMIERQVLRILSEARISGLIPEGIGDEDAKAALGLEKFPHLVEVAGDHPEICSATRAGGHVGLHPDLFKGLDPVPVRLLLTIENYASFNRAYREISAPGVVFLYTGGWPGRAERVAISHFASAAAEVRHWGDIDMAGAAIADAVWKAAGRPIGLHQMSPELALSHGTPASFKPFELAENSPARSLVFWLSSPGAHRLEQEEIDPVLTL